jgi:hypothetical protein
MRKFALLLVFAAFAHTKAFAQEIPIVADDPVVPGQKVPLVCSDEDGKTECHVGVPKSKPEVPTTPFTTEQKALLDGTAPKPEPTNPYAPYVGAVAQTVPIPDGATIIDPEKIREHQAELNRESEEMVRRNNVELEQQRQRIASQQQTMQQQNYQAGYAVGQAAGHIVGALIARHHLQSKITKWCKEHPGHDHGVQLANGESIYCDEWNNGNHSASDSDAQNNDVQNYVRGVMEEIRTFLDKHNPQNDLQRKLYAEDVNNWYELQKSYCQGARGWKYIDLTGAEQTCR